MGTIATNFETVGISETASVSIDVDAMVRKAMIKLFGLKDANGNDMDEYDDAYLDAGLPSEKKDSDDPGMPSLTRGFIIFETETLSFMFQQVLYILTPIKTALELPQYLANPQALIEKIKEIIENIKKMIEDVTKFITDTKQWFIDTLLGGLADINVPIPEITITILGVDITLPKIDKNDLFNTDTWLKKDPPQENPFEEKNLDKITKLKDDVLELQKKLSNLKDNIKDIMDNMIKTLTELQVQLKSVLYKPVYEYFELVYELHNVIVQKMADANSVDNLSKTELEAIQTELENITDKDGLIIFNGSVARLLAIPSELTAISVKELEFVTSYYTEKGITLAMDQINQIKSDMVDKLTELTTPIDELKENIQAILDIKDAALDELSENVEQIEQEIRDKIKEKMDEIISLSPATAWILSMVNLFINIVKAPINFIIDLITKLMEGVIEFLQELPIPTFEKFKEFFGDLLGLANVSKMSDFVTGILESLAPFADPDLIAKIAEFLPDLIITTGVKFIDSIVKPLPIPI